MKERAKDARSFHHSPQMNWFSDLSQDLVDLKADHKFSAVSSTGNTESLSESMATRLDGIDVTEHLTRGLTRDIPM